MTQGCPRESATLVVDEWGEAICDAGIGRASRLERLSTGPED
jgi:hypothetical protein